MCLSLWRCICVDQLAEGIANERGVYEAQLFWSPSTPLPPSLSFSHSIALLPTQQISYVRKPKFQNKESLPSKWVRRMIMLIGVNGIRDLFVFVWKWFAMILEEMRNLKRRKQKRRGEGKKVEKKRSGKFPLLELNVIFVNGR